MQRKLVCANFAVREWCVPTLFASTNAVQKGWRAKERLPAGVSATAMTRRRRLYAPAYAHHLHHHHRCDRKLFPRRGLEVRTFEPFPNRTKNRTELPHGETSEPTSLTLMDFGFSCFGHWDKALCALQAGWGPAFSASASFSRSAPLFFLSESTGTASLLLLSSHCSTRLKERCALLCHTQLALF